MMNKFFRSVLSVVLIISIILTSSISAFAATEEVYLSDLRIIYADDYSEAKEILSTTEFKTYKLLNENLNEGTKETGVWLAYKTTTDIEDAITDLAVMQMDGGYQSGNYQEMLKASKAEYEEMCNEYAKVIDYFVEAYDSGDFLAEMAYRQLNFYTVKTIGLPEKDIPSFEGELLGDIFYEGIDSKKLAEMFMEGNTYVLSNVRELLAMGVSYNEDGSKYLDKVGEMAEEMDGDPASYVDDVEYYDSMAALISPTIKTIKDMLKELDAYEDELNFDDEEVTEGELKYAENQAIANMTRNVTYLDGETLYDFCLNYIEDKNDYSTLYPLVAALNEGQEVMTKLSNYYEAIRYSMTDYPEEFLEEEVEKLEEEYGENPFNVYEGVDRTVFKGTFALTTAASREDAYTDSNTLADAYFGGLKSTILTGTSIASGVGGIGFMFWGAMRKKAEGVAAITAKNEALKKAAELYQVKSTETWNALAAKTFSDSSVSYENLMDSFASKYLNESTAGLTFYKKFKLAEDSANTIFNKANPDEFQQFQEVIFRVKQTKKELGSTYDQMKSEQLAQLPQTHMATSTVLYLVGGAMLLYSAFMLSYTAYSYYHPDYSDIPISLVDMRETQYGDRYIKYEAVLEAELNGKKTYSAGDLNAFEAERWNALYYTKSYEAGKPLLADEFVLSTNNNRAKDGYTPVHRFGEVICYDLNKYNFSNKSPSIYLSVKQSKNDKAAVADVPEVVGSIFSGGLWMLFGGVGAIFGIGGTLGTQALLKKRKTKNSEQNA